MSLFVPDASVLLKWILPGDAEPSAEQAIGIRDDFVAGRIDLVVPPLWFYEVGNVLVAHHPRLAAPGLASLAALRIPEARPSEQWRGAIVELAVRIKATFYDASYHALAVVSDGVFVTADEKYLRKARPDRHAMALADWQSR